MPRAHYCVLFIAAAFIIGACRPPQYTPKPRGYFRYTLPKHAYQPLIRPDLPYRFDYPVYGEILQDTNLTGGREANKYSIDIDFPTLGGRVYLDYKSITAQNSLDKLLDDAHEMSWYHVKRADFINAKPFHNDNGVHGLFIDVGGNAASAYQFIATDSSANFLRGALYFNVTPNADSIKPVADFLRKDMEYMLGTLRWK